jgi:hypothetical protein
MGSDGAMSPLTSRHCARVNALAISRPIRRGSPVLGIARQASAGDAHDVRLGIVVVDAVFRRDQGRLDAARV